MQIGIFSIMIAKLCAMNTWSSINKAKFQNSFVLYSFFLYISLSLLLILANDVELNLGTKKDSSKRNFSIAHWNLNSIAAQNFVKLSQLEAYFLWSPWKVFLQMSELFCDCNCLNSKDLLFLVLDLYWMEVSHGGCDIIYFFLPWFKIFFDHLLARTLDSGMIDPPVSMNWDGGSVKRVADSIHNGKEVWQI